MQQQQKQQHPAARVCVLKGTIQVLKYNEAFHFRTLRRGLVSSSMTTHTLQQKTSSPLS